jgi:tripartite-type tricarboxylate transporter receptor subunit TctC
MLRLLQKLVACIVLLCAAFAPAVAADGDYPTKPIKWIVSYPPGGTTDLLARLMGQWLSQRLGQQVIIVMALAGLTRNIVLPAPALFSSIAK